MDPLKRITNQDKGRPGLVAPPIGVPVFVPPGEPTAGKPGYTFHGAPGSTPTIFEPNPHRTHQLLHGTAVAGTLYAILRFIPHPLAKTAGVLLAGASRTPAGEIAIGSAFASNLAPIPFGYVDPAAYGLKSNFYLPEGTGKYIPEQLFPLGLGLKEQRQEFIARELARIEAARVSPFYLARESDDTLARLLSGEGGFTRAGELLATSGLPLRDLQFLAARERARRELLVASQNRPVIDFGLGGPPTTPTAATTPTTPTTPTTAGASAALGALVPPNATAGQVGDQEPSSGGGGGFGRALMAYAPDP